MAFDPGTLLDQRMNIAGSFPDQTFNDDMDIDKAETLGDVLQASESGTTVATDEITPNTAADSAYIGGLIVVSGVVGDNGTYLITGINGGNYVVVDDTMGDPGFGGGSGSIVIYGFPSLIDDLNYLRTLIKDINGESEWYNETPTYPNPDNTSNNTPINLEHLKNKHGKAMLMRRYTIANNSGSGYSISTGDTDLVVTDTTAYTGNTRLTGIPTEDGASTPDSTNYNLTFVRICEHGTKEPLSKDDGTPIWGRLIDGANATGGTGEGTDVGIKFYTGDNDGTASAYTVDAETNGKAVDVVYYVIDSMSDFTRNQMPVNEGGAFLLNGADAELYDDVNDLQEFTGGGDNETTPTIINSTNYYPFSSGAANGLTDPADTDLEEMANALNDMIGELDFTAEQEAIIGGDGSTLTITDMLAGLADAIEDVAGLLIINYKHTGAQVDPGTAFTIPGGNAYTPNVGTTEAGRYMQVYFNGQLLQANRSDYNNDYEETDTTNITMNYKTIQSNDRLTFAILA